MGRCGARASRPPRSDSKRRGASGCKSDCGRAAREGMPPPIRRCCKPRIGPVSMPAGRFAWCGSQPLFAYSSMLNSDMRKEARRWSEFV
jgi:hypothetical protein